METLVRDKCPFCGSLEIQFKKKANVWECAECEQRFEQPALEGDLRRPSDRAIRPLAIFLSYGHDDNRPLVDQFKSDLEARGHTVWLDAKDIGTWDDWKGKITQGIHNSQLAIAFLSIHSIRDPGVCRNEIAIALNRFGTIYPVLLEKAAESDIPLAIRHLQWPDLSEWQTIRDGKRTDADWKRWYQNKFMEMVAKLEGEATRFADETRVLRQVLFPSSFESRIAQHIPGFIGRDWVFDAYRNWLDEQPKSRLFWIKAGPGVGKSAIAANLAHRFRDSVMASWFCEARSAELASTDQILKSISFQLALRLPDFRVQLLRLLGITANTPDDLCEQAYKELAGKSPTDLFRILLAEPFAHLIWREHKLVIVVDALDEATDEQYNNRITDFIASELAQLPEWVGFVVTSRPEAAISSRLQGFKPFELEAHDARNVADLKLWYGIHLGQQPVLRTLPDAEQQRLQRLLIERSDGMILYLKMVELGLDEGSLTLDDLDHLDSGLPGLHGYYFQSFIHRFGDTYETEVKPLLRLLLAASPLPEDLLREILQWNSEEFLQSCNTLGSYLIETPSGFELFHKTLGEWLSSRQSGQFHIDRQIGMQAIADALFAELDRAEDTHQARWNRLAAHYLPRWLQDLRQRDDPAAFVRLGNLLAELARFGEAEPHYREALKMMRTAKPGDYLLLASSLGLLANLLRDTGRYVEAEPLYHEALGSLRAALPIRHPQIALFLNNLASLLYLTGRYDEAEPLYRDTLDIWSVELPAGHRLIATGLSSLANLLYTTCRYGEAESLFRKSLDIDRAALPAGHPDIAKSLNNLASLLFATGGYEEAERLYREAVDIERAALPARHPQTALGLHNLANVLCSTGRYDDAEPLHREAVDIERVALPPGHPQIALGLSNLAGLLRDTGRFEEAERLYHEALDILPAVLPPGHPDIANSLNHLANLLYMTSRYDEAEPLYREALYIRRAVLSAEHRDIATSLNNLANLLYTTSRHDEAEPLYREALDIQRAALPPGHLDIAISLNHLANLLDMTSRHDEAEQLYREALDIRRTVLSAGHRDIATSLNNLANLLYRTSRHDEAEPLYREVLDIARAVLPAGHLGVAMSLDNLANLFCATGRYENAESLYREALDIRRAALRAGHLDITISLGNLAYLLEITDRYNAAEPFYRELVALHREKSPETQGELALHLNSLANVLRKTGHFLEAESLHKESLAIYCQNLPEGHEYVGCVKQSYARTLIAAGRAAEAEGLLQDALAVFRKTLPPDHEWTQSCLSDLAELHHSTGRPYEPEGPLSLDGAS